MTDDRCIGVQIIESSCDLSFKKALSLLRLALSVVCFYICNYSKNFKSTIIRSFIPFRALILCLFCGFFHPALAQVHFSAQASMNDMGRTDYVELQFIVENAKEIGDIQMPDLSDFTIVQGPNQSSGMSVVNGAVSQYKGISLVLQPKKTGSLIIKPASALVDGHPLHTNTIRIQVHSQPGNGNSKPPAFSPFPDPSWPSAQPRVDVEDVLKPGENITEKINRNFFIRLNVSKMECFVGEPIVATYKLYTRVRSQSSVTRHPSLNGFSVYDMEDPSDDRVSVEKINGKNFTVHTIRKTQLIPLQPGDITLDPVETDNNIYFIKQDKNPSRNTDQGLGSLLDRLFQPEPTGTQVSQHVVLASKPLTIHVKPLPEAGKPADFTGAVGKYSISASIDSKEVDTGDAAILTVMVRGNGNLPVINAPVIRWPAGMESYDVNSKENIDKATAPLSGTKTFNYSFISTKAGNYDLPPIQLSYFDLASKTYKSTESNPLHIEVLAKKKKRPNPAPAPAVQPDHAIYIWLSVAILLMLAIVWAVIRQLKKNVRIKTEKVKQLAALEKIKSAPVAIDPLSESRMLMTTGDFGKFYSSVNRAIWKSVSDKLQLPASELNKLNIASGLRGKGWRDEDIIQLKNILNECEMKLYTPEYSTSDMQRVLDAASEICTRLNT
jgi:hypothetical protein